MADISLERIEQLFDKKFTAMNGQLEDRMQELGQDNAQTRERITELAKQVDEGVANAATTAQIDTLANHLQEFRDNIGSQLNEQGDTLARIERRLNTDLDRLDDHGQRIETLEAKTAHLPAPPPHRE